MANCEWKNVHVELPDNGQHVVAYYQERFYECRYFAEAKACNGFQPSYWKVLTTEDDPLFLWDDKFIKDQNWSSNIHDGPGILFWINFPQIQ